PLHLCTFPINPVQSTQKIPALLEAPPYLRHFPPMIQQSLTKSWTLRPMETVDSNSLCGLGDLVKMLSWLSGKKSTTISRVARIHVEELGPCYFDHWIRMPTKTLWLNQTFFPFSALLKNNPPIFIGLTESQHFAILKMKDKNIYPEAQ
ncbi:hypothetical protein VP01_6450g1, partial [Puccinia sorghi]